MVEGSALENQGGQDSSPRTGQQDPGEGGGPGCHRAGEEEGVVAREGSSGVSMLAHATLGVELVRNNGWSSSGH